jgi:Mor family transcriptional regulator
VQALPRAENREAVQTLFRRLCSDFGHSSGKAIIRVIVEELGGMRITVPGFKDIYREERKRKICNLFNGANHKELAIMFDLTEGSRKEIVNRRG